MGYIAKRPCSFGGKRFLTDEAIPDQFIDPMAISRLKSVGLISSAPKKDKFDRALAVCTVQILQNGEAVDLQLTNEDLSTIFQVLQSTTKDAEKMLKDIRKKETLLLIHGTDGRKTVKEQAEAQLLGLGQVLNQKAEQKSKAGEA